jgi:hypothetical protein
MSEGITFSEMVAVCASEATRIEDTQARLVATGDRGAADPDQLRRMRVFEAIIHMIDLVRGDDVILNRLRRKTAPSPKATNDKTKGPDASHRAAGSEAP